MTEKQKTSEIGKINLQIDKIKEEIRDSNTQIKKYIEKRNQLHEQVRKSREQIKQLKIERDEINEKVKLLKEQRDLLRVGIAPIMEEVNSIEEKIIELKKNVPRTSQRILQEELDAVEWKIQTNTLDLQEERSLIEEVKQFEIQLISYKKINKKQKRIKELLTQRKTLDAQADVYHKELTDFAKKSQDLHSKIIENIDAVKREREEADKLHQAFLEKKKQNSILYEQISQLINQTRGLETSIKEYDQTIRREEENKRKEEQAERANKEQAIKEKLSYETKEKLQRGEKINWDEFQLLLDEDEETDSKTQD